MAKQKLKDQNFSGFTTMYDRYVEYVSSLTDSARRTKLILSIVVIVVLAAVSSVLPYLPFWSADSFSGDSWGIWVQTIIAFPAGILFFAILVGLQKTTKIQEWKLSSFKEIYSHRQRIQRVAIGLVVLVAGLIFVGGVIPYGVGGIVMMGVILTAYNLLRRTPIEIKYAELGAIDPRDVNPDGTIPESVVTEAQNNANTFNQEKK